MGLISGGESFSFLLLHPHYLLDALNLLSDGVTGAFLSSKAGGTRSWRLPFTDKIENIERYLHFPVFIACRLINHNENYTHIRMMMLWHW
jgi:hypothetical protein